MAVLVHSGVAGSALAAIVSASSAFALYIVCLVIYRVFFHPLSRYPGPFLAKITDLYSTYYAWIGTRHLDFLRQHEKYGPIVRYGPNKLAFNTHTAYHTIHQVNANVRKSDMYMGFSASLPSIFGAIPKDLHARKRRILGSAFTDKAIKSMEEYMLQHTRIFCDILASTPQAVDVAALTTYLTGDMLGDLAFGKSFETQTSSENRFALEMITAASKYAQVSGAGINLRNPFITKLLFRKLLASHTRFKSFAQTRAIGRMKMTDTNRRDFYHYLIEAKNPNTDEKYEPTELWAEASTLIAAGADTSSSALSATFFYLTRNPPALKRVQEEVREKFKGQDIEAINWGTELKSCVYLKACLDEAMRMTPAVPGLLSRTVLAGGIEIDGHKIAEGTEVGVSHYPLFHNPFYFSDPFSYRPSRWLLPSSPTAAEEDALRTAQLAFVPFSIGSRGCIGKNLAVMEMITTMARVIFAFDFEAEKVDGKEAEEGGVYHVRDAFICDKKGPWIVFKPRKV